MMHVDETQLMKGTGVLEGRRPTDYIAGAATAIVYEERLSDGQWGSLLPLNENQSAVFDTMACVTYSALNCIEVQVKYLSGHEVNYSDRFIAKLSETMKEGNYAWKVAETIRHTGLVDESRWLWDISKIFTWDQYYSPIPDEVVKEVLEFLEDYDVQYEWVASQNPFGATQYASVDEIKYHLKQSPLQIGIPICSPYNTSSVLKPCGKTRSEHAVMLYGYDDESWLIFDHYHPHRKRLSFDYIIPWVFKYVVTNKSNKHMEFLTKNNKKIVQDSQEGRSGTFAYIKDGRVLYAEDQKDLLEILATEAAENRGTGVPGKVWDELPRVAWKNRNN